MAASMVMKSKGRVLLRTTLNLCLLLLGSGCDSGYDLVIRGGRVIDPETGIDGEFNVAIQEDRIAEVTLDPVAGKMQIDADGLVVAPGFIDVLTFAPAQEVMEKYKVLDGVTSIIFGHDGAIDVPFYFEFEGRIEHRIHFGTLVRGARPFQLLPEWRRMRLDDNLLAGGLGIAATPEYNHETYEELLFLAETAARYDVPLVLHLRGSSVDDELAGLEEAISLARKTGVRIHAMHIHSTGATYHPVEAMTAIREARAEGLRVSADVYPYTYWMTDFRSARFDDFQTKYGLTYEDLIVAGTGDHLTESEFNRRRNERIYVAVPEGTIPDESLTETLRQPFVFVASDGQIESETGANMHPRGAGAFATAFVEGRKRGLDLATIVRKVSTDPAQLYAPISRDLSERGGLAPGKIADITVFDPDRLRHRGTIEKPAVASEGIEWVIVAGEVVVRAGELQERYPGRPLRSSLMAVRESNREN